VPPHALAIVNPGAETADLSAYVNAANVLMRRSDNTKRSGASCFATTNVGAYDHYQDVALDPADYAEVDAGVLGLRYTGYGMTWNGAASTLTMYAKALDALGGVLQTWSAVIPNKSNVGNNYGAFIVNGETLPVGTRAVRFGWSGNCAAVQDIWIDDLSARVELANAVTAEKLVTYVAVGALPEVMLTEKLTSYAVLGPGYADRLAATKLVSYGVLTPVARLVLRKAVTYAVVARRVGLGEYDGVLMACSDRPMFNVFGPCGERPASVIEPCGARPDANSFRPGEHTFPRGG
jgi:hypothetical protein